MHSKRLFVDMDGVLAKYEMEAYLGNNPDWLKPGYFKGLEKQQNVCDAIEMLLSSKIESNKIKICILSAVNDDQAKKDKIEWLKVHVPKINIKNCYFPLCGTQKANVVPGGISHNDFLLDDRALNLHSWEASGGIGIRLKNDINRGRSWNSYTIGYLDPPEIIVDKICKIAMNPHITKGKTVKQHNRDER